MTFPDFDATGDPAPVTAGDDVADEEGRKRIPFWVEFPLLILVALAGCFFIYMPPILLQAQMLPAVLRHGRFALG